MIRISEHPEHAALTKEVNGLAIALGKVNSRIAEIESSVRAPVKDNRESQSVAAAMRFAETGTVEGVGGPDSLSEERAVLLVQAEALKKAIASRQQERLELERTLSAELCSELTPDHRDLAARYLKVLQQLDALHGEEETLFDQIEKNGYDVRFPTRINWHFVGRLKHQSESALWHHACEIEGYSKVKCSKGSA